MEAWIILSILEVSMFHHLCGEIFLTIRPIYGGLYTQSLNGQSIDSRTLADIGDRLFGNDSWLS